MSDDCAGAPTFLTPQFAAAGPLAAYPAAPTAAIPAPMQLTPAAGPGGAVQAVQPVNAVVPVSLSPAMYAAPPPAPRPPGPTPGTAFAATPAAYQPIVYWYPSPPVSPQTAPYYVQTTLPTTVLMKGLPPNIQMHDVMSFLDGLVEVSYQVPTSVS